jgi:hypothetical protein
MFSGLGFMTGSYVSSLMGSWKWGLRVTPIFGALCILAIFLLVKEPERGQAEKAMANGSALSKKMTGVDEKSTYVDDIKYLCGM